MKKFILACSLFAIACTVAWAQTDKSKRPSPPANVKVKTNDGVLIEIDYSRPSLKGRKIGTDVAPFGKVWRTGANEATTIEVDRDVTIEVDKGVVVDRGNLPAGKYSIHSIPGEERTTVIFNKVWEKSGSQYDEKQDALRLTADNRVLAGVNQEQFKFDVSPAGLVTMSWGAYVVAFTVRAK